MEGLRALPFSNFSYFIIVECGIQQNEKKAFDDGPALISQPIRAMNSKQICAIGEFGN
jgi:hypothetical protein